MRIVVVLAAASAFGVPATSSSPPTTAFGGAGSVHIPHVGHIEVDLESPSGTGLRRVACAAPTVPEQTCYVAR